MTRSTLRRRRPRRRGVSEFSYTDEVDSGVASKSYVYNVWNGARQLWNDGAFMIAAIVVTWSGCGRGQAAHPRVRNCGPTAAAILPVAYEWLSARALVVRRRVDGRRGRVSCKFRTTATTRAPGVASSCSSRSRLARVDLRPRQGRRGHFFSRARASQGGGARRCVRADAADRRPARVLGGRLTPPSRMCGVCLAHVHYAALGCSPPPRAARRAPPRRRARARAGRARACDAARRARGRAGR